MRGARPASWAVAGAVVPVAAWLALVQVFWLPFRLGGVLVPLSVPAAVVGNVLLVRAAWQLTGSRVVAVLPAVVWLAVAVAAMSRRPEGDLLITSGGAGGLVNLAFLLLGVLAAALSVGRAMTSPAGPPRRSVGPAPPVSGSGEA